MSATLFLAVLFAAFLHAGWNALVKTGDDKFLAMFILSTSQGAIGLLMTLVLQMFATSLTQMVDFVTIVAFLTGPVLGYLNLRVITSPNVPREHQPGKAMLIYSYVGLVSLGAVALIFIVSRFV